MKSLDWRNPSTGLLVALGCVAVALVALGQGLPQPTRLILGLTGGLILPVRLAVVAARRAVSPDPTMSVAVGLLVVTTTWLLGSFALLALGLGLGVVFVVVLTLVSVALSVVAAHVTARDEDRAPDAEAVGEVDAGVG